MATCRAPPSLNDFAIQMHEELDLVQFIFSSAGGGSKTFFSSLSNVVSVTEDCVDELGPDF